MASILIANALIVNEGRSHHQDLLIHNDRIEAIGGDLSGKKADRVVDADVIPWVGYEESTSHSYGTSTAWSAPSEAAVLSSDFKNNRGRLPWPVQNGVITGVFGR